jgi:hypothetical protein
MLLKIIDRKMNNQLKAIKRKNNYSKNTIPAELFKQLRVAGTAYRA